MNLADLNKVAEAMVAPGKGILAADESTGTIKKRFDAINAECTEDNRRDYREMMFRAAEAMRSTSPASSSTTRPSGRRPRTARRWSRSSRRPARIPGIKVDEGTKPLPELPGRTHHRRPRQARRPPAEILRAGRALRQMARGDRHRRGHPELRPHPRQRPCARALRRALPGRADRADRRAGSADGRRSRHRPLLRGHRMGAEGDSSRSFTASASRSKASCSSRTWRSPARRARKQRRRRGGRREDRAGC